VLFSNNPLQPAGVASRTWWGGTSTATTGYGMIAAAFKYR
jgi:hypothetical protein